MNMESLSVFTSSRVGWVTLVCRDHLNFGSTTSHLNTSLSCRNSRELCDFESLDNWKKYWHVRKER